jgi:hypothetical protein
MNETPDTFFSGGPYLSVALPDSLQRVVPGNLTSLLREWESMLDPLADLRVAALTELRGEWLIKNWFVEPSGDTLRLLREAGKDEQVVRAFTVPDAGRVQDPQAGWQATFSDLALDRETLANQALPVLLGLAVRTAVSNGLGQASASLWVALVADRVDRDGEAG